MQFKPLRDNLVIKADKENNRTESGFTLVREWEKLPHYGEVTAIGPKCTEVKTGDRVRFNRYAFEKVGEDEFIGLERNVVAIINE